MVRPDDSDQDAKFLESCIVSVYQAAFVQQPAPANMPAQFLPRPLMEAVEGIMRLGSFTDQKQAVALIVSAGLNLKHPDGKEAVGLLGTQLLPNHPDEVRRLQEMEPLADDPMATQLIVDEIIDSHNVGGGACAGTKLAYWASMNDHTKVTTAKASIQVEDHPFDLDKVIGLNHPFQWKVNWPGYFYSSDPCLAEYDYMTGVPVLVSPPRLPLYLPWNIDTNSTANPRHHLYEDLRFNAYLVEPEPGTSIAGTPNIYAAQFRNILGVTWTGATANSSFMKMEYYLHNSTFCQLLFGSLRNGPNGLLTDGGYMTSERTTTGWKWISVKYIRFDDLTPGRPQTPGIPDFGQAMNYIAPTLLTRFITTGLQNSCC